MTTAEDLAACNWQDVDGGEIAIAICTFLEGIGIPVSVGNLEEPTLLTGMTVRDGGILVDQQRPCWVGDLLHEAGHVAVTLAEKRTTLNEITNDPGEEMAAIAWSVAAAKACNVPLKTLFHSEGYKGGSASLIEAFSNDNSPFGTPLLAWYGMTEQAVFPAMKRWLR